ncbi:DUF3352 domain-containing protein [Chamaesiphon sp. VAR_48_metabat_403]|uniref:DUF3352 domain-containing protein n=1 Tax=Chamaesiphon sp. VAR_48_metabat_403 TaxID=2964700 RepID=UPI00286DE658|nr:DUF3352 domain-containing protein [Chamaesiphon sp. VAR_48_metabat_403]
MPNKMPNQKSRQPIVSKKQQQIRRVVVGVGAASLLVALAAGGWRLLSGNSNRLDTSNGVSLLPQDTLLSIAISTDPVQWQKFSEFGIPISRGVIEQQLANFQTNFLTNYGYDYQRDIQPWVGKQVLLGVLNNPGAVSSKSDRAKIPTSQTVVILPIVDRGAAQKAVEQHQTPVDANLVESNYKGVAIREFKRKTGTMAIAMLDNFVAIASDKPGLQRVIDAQQSGKSLLVVPGYTKALTEIEIDRPFVQVYANIPVATAVAAANSPQNLAADKLAQAQVQQGIAANARLEAEGIAWKGISWLKPNTKQKLVVENQGQNFAANLPATTLVMVSGGNLQRLWQDYARSADTNPIAPVKPADLVKNLENLTGLELESEILNWSKGAFAAAIVPKSDRIDTEFGAGLVVMQQVSDRSTAEKAFARLDNTMGQKQIFKIAKAKVNGQDVVNWTSPLNITAASHGWLDRNVAFLNLGAPVTPIFLPKPQQSLADSTLFQQATKSSLTTHNGQFFIDVDRTINAGNLLLPYMSPEVKAGLKAVKSLGVTSAILDESSNRFDLFVSLKKEPGVAKLPIPQSGGYTNAPKAIKPAPKPSTSPSSTPKPSP